MTGDRRGKGKDTVTLRDHIEQRFIDLERRFVEWKEMENRALVLAKEAADEAARRLQEALTVYKASQNEWGETFRNLQDAFRRDVLPRGETLQKFDELEKLIERNTEQINIILRGESKEVGVEAARLASGLQVKWVIGFIISIITLAAALVYFLVGRN